MGVNTTSLHLLVETNSQRTRFNCLVRKHLPSDWPLILYYVFHMRICIGTNISDFMAFYWETFPDASVLPKMHMLESHVVPYFKQWGVGLGLMGEQGAESIHAAVNGISRAYANTEVCRLVGN